MNNDKDIREINEEPLCDARGGSLGDSLCNVKCRHCGDTVRVLKASYMSENTIYTAHHLCTQCGSDLYGSAIV